MTANPKLIGITGFKGCGKSSVSAFLATKGFRVIPFAAPLKAMLLTLGLTPEQVYGSQKEEPSGLLSGRTPRHAMQTLGTEWGRNCIDPNLWINLWSIQVAEAMGHGYSVVADDLRFLNEAAVLRGLAGKVWRITRPGFLRTPHLSEGEMVSITPDYILHNDRTLADLEFCISPALIAA